MAFLLTEKLPALPKSRPLSLTDKELLIALLNDYPPHTSEMTFTNLFAWSNTHPVHLTRVGEAVVVWRGSPDGGLLLSPIGILEREGVRQALEWSIAMGGKAEFGRISEEEVEMLLAAEPMLRAREDRDSFDYVYRQAGLANLSGRNFDGKRNLIKKFDKVVPKAQLMPIEGELIRECSLMQDLWCDIKTCETNPHLAAEDLSVRMVLDNWEHLNLIGGALVGEDGVIGFSVAEKLSPDTAVIHFEKADAKYPGIYQALNNRFTKEMLSEFIFINREQDLGVEGLRKAKLSYYPDHMVKKFTVSKTI